mgnify:CR=1 FL=1
MPFIPHTDQEVRELLEAFGVDGIVNRCTDCFSQPTVVDLSEIIDFRLSRNSCQRKEQNNY